MMKKKEVEREWARMHPVSQPLMFVVMAIGFLKIYADIGHLCTGEAFNPYEYLFPLIIGVMIVAGQASIRRKARVATSEQHPSGDAPKAASEE